MNSEFFLNGIKYRIGYKYNGYSKFQRTLRETLMNKVFISKEIQGPTDTESLLCFIHQKIIKTPCLSASSSQF